MAGRGKVNNWRQVVGLVIALVVIVLFMSMGLVMRDYKLTNTGSGLHWVSRYPVPTVSALNLRSPSPGHLEMSTREVSGVAGYEFRVSRSKHMWFSQTYRTAKIGKELGMMKEGKTYYVQVRGYKQNDKGRTVFGQYSSIKSCTIQKSQKTPLLEKIED